ncbi:MAG: DUF3820 family protein [Gammaproteobacteria bacterium]|nr:DUF3820 family protein [Gammaproteobacteria bacterium]
MFDKKNLIKLARQRMPFGKYQGKTIIDLPEEYLLWFAKKEFPKGELGILMQLALEIKINGLESLLTPLKHKEPKTDVKRTIKF